MHIPPPPPPRHRGHVHPVHKTHKNPSAQWAQNRFNMMVIRWTMRANKNRRTLKKYLEDQNAAAAELRKALPKDPLDIPPLEWGRDPDGGPVGRIENVEFRLAGVQWHSLRATLTIARWTPTGKPKPNVVVEMRGARFTRGALIPGDWVQLPKGYEARKRLSQLANLTRGTQVEMQGRWIDLGRIDGLIPLFQN
jgi:hypothetical protein